MTALLLTALFALVTLISAATIADAVVRSRNAFRQMRGELALAGADRAVTVCWEDSQPDTLPLPPLRSLRVSATRRMRQAQRCAERLRAAA